VFQAAIRLGACQCAHWRQADVHSPAKGMMGALALLQACLAGEWPYSSRPDLHYNTGQRLPKTGSGHRPAPSEPQGGRAKEVSMPEEVRQVEQYSLTIANKAGEGARVLGIFRDAGVNLLAFWGYQRTVTKAELIFVPENSAAFATAAKQAKLKLGKKQTALFVQGEDRTGAAADLLAKLAAGKINVGAVQAVCAGAGRFGAVVFLPTAALARKAAGILGAGTSKEMAASA
jgi:hypothetical protein